MTGAYDGWQQMPGNSLMKKIHVVHVVESFAAGCLTSIAMLCRVMQTDFRFSVIHSLRPETPENFKTLFPPEVEFYYLPEMENRINLKKNFLAYSALKTTLKKISPNVLHCHSSIAGFLGRMAAFSGGWPVVYSPRGYSFLRVNIGSFNKTTCAIMEWLAARGKSITVACGKQEYKLAARLSPKGKYFFIPNALDLSQIENYIDTSQIKNNKMPLLTGTCGRLSSARNYKFFSNVVNSVTETGWIWLGAPEDTTQIPETVMRTGWQTREEALAGMAKLDIYVHTSAWDGLSNTLLEAMALGKPVVATDIPANSAVIKDGITGFLCKNEQQMSEIIKKLLTDSAMRKKIGEAARRYIQNNHDAARVYQNFATLYRHLSGADNAA